MDFLMRKFKYYFKGILSLSNNTLDDANVNRNIFKKYFCKVLLINL